MYRGPDQTSSYCTMHLETLQILNVCASWGPGLRFVHVVTLASSVLQQTRSRSFVMSLEDVESGFPMSLNGRPTL